MLVPYLSFIIKYANMYSLPPYIVAAVIEVESNWNPLAVSSAGAVGLMQVIPGLREGDGTKRPSKDELFNPETNIKWGCKILGGLFERYKSLDKALAGYYGGVRNGVITDQGWRYVELVHQAAKNYYFIAPCTDAFKEYAPESGCWEEAAINLKGIATDLLDKVRAIRDYVNRTLEGL